MYYYTSISVALQEVWVKNIGICESADQPDDKLGAKTLTAWLQKTIPADLTVRGMALDDYVISSFSR